jgi:hypothetical protein
MSVQTLERDDLSIYVIAGVPRSFKSRLVEFVRKESKKDGDVVLVDAELADWIIARLRDKKRPSHVRTSASRALWRAFSALSAARYHLQDDGEAEERVRELRRRVEDLWREFSPMFPDEAADTEDDDEEATAAADVQ